MDTEFSKEIELTAEGRENLRLTLRTLSHQHDYEKFTQLEKRIWGMEFVECVPASMLMISQKVGGLVAGAFDTAGHMLAMLFGLTGPLGKQNIHWSHMMGVDVAYQGFGLGKQMKCFQREFLLKVGIKEVRWTYDPLTSKNAHLNINHLGALPLHYEHNVYGDGDDSGLHAGIGTDRFTVTWKIAEERVARMINKPQRETKIHKAIIVNTDDNGSPLEGEFPLPEDNLIRVEIPKDIQLAKERALNAGLLWRNNMRRAFDYYLTKGWHVVGFHYHKSSGRSFYELLAGKGP